jgi:Mce-associated membrane protein
MAARWTHGMTRTAGRMATRLVSRLDSTGRTVTATLAAAAVALLALSGYFAHQLYGQHQEEQRRQDVLSAARQTAVNFTSLHYETYESDSRNVLKGATGRFKKQFAAQTEELTKLVTQNKSVSKGQVLEAGVVRADEKTARVLVVADSTVKNVSTPEGETRNYRLQLDLAHEHGRWLTSNVEFVA